MGYHSSTEQALFQLADPRQQPTMLPKLTDAQWERLFELAGTHGVLGIVLGNLAGHDLPTTPSWEFARRRWRAELVISLRLRRHAIQLQEAFAAASIPAAVVKGIDFADHLYPQPHLRPTRDVDILVPRHYWDEAARVLEDMGYFKKPGPWSKHEVEEYGELCWRHRMATDIAIELHWNLVRNPSLRRRASLSYSDIIATPSSKAPCLTPASRLVIAAVHAAITHQFDRILLLCDIREACRQLADSSSLKDLHELVDRTGSRAAIDVALAVTARLFKDSEIAELRNRLGARPILSLGAALVSKQTLVHSTRPWHSLRRSLLREWLKRAA